MKLGEYLKSQREGKGIRLEEIASITKIHLHTLQLIETGEWKRLPPEPFIRGFITAYAKYVGLNPRDIMERYNQERHPATEASTPTPIPPPPNEVGHDSASQVIERNRLPAPRTVMMLGGLCVALGTICLVVYVGKRASLSSDPAQQVTANSPSTAPTVVTPAGPSVGETIIAKMKDAQPPAAKTETTPAATANPAPAPEEKAVLNKPAFSSPVAETKEVPATAAPAKDIEHTLTVEAKERTWMKIVIDGTAPVEAFLEPGENKRFEAKKKIKLVLGNSTGAQVVHNGEPFLGVKFNGTIRSYIFPSDARFPQDQPKRAVTSKSDNDDSRTSEAAGSDGTNPSIPSN